MVSCRGPLLILAFFGRAAALTAEQQRNIVLGAEEKLYRIFSPAVKVHNYHINRNAICKARAAGHEFKNTVGHVVSTKLYNEKLKDECPELKKASIYRVTPTNGAPVFTYIGIPPSRWAKSVLQGEFYCATTKGYCGANQPFYELNTYNQPDMVYTDDIREAQSYKRNPVKVCYIWVSQPSVEHEHAKDVRAKLIEEKSVIHRVGLNYPNNSVYMNRISTHEQEAKDIMPWSNWMYQFKDTVAYVVKECAWEQRVKQQCPELKRMHVTRIQVNNWPTQITNGTQLPDAPGCSSNHFYCARERGYCGADKPILSIRSTDVAYRDINYPSSEWETDERMCMDTRYANVNTIHCYGWAEDDFYRKSC